MPEIQEIKKGDVEWIARVKGGIEFYQPDALRTETKLIKDVLQAAEDKRLEEFVLIFNKLGYKYGVDFSDGQFIINGLKIDLAPEVPKCNLRLIYYLRHRGVLGPNTPFSEAKFNLHSYLVGWQTTCSGKNVQRFLAIDPETGKTELMSKR